MEGHNGSIYAVAFSPDGSKLLTGGWDKTARLWDTATGSLQHTCEAQGGDIWAVAFSASTPFGGSVGEDRIVRVFHTEQKKEIAELKAHTGTLYAATAAISPPPAAMERLASGICKKSPSNRLKNSYLEWGQSKFD